MSDQPPQIADRLREEVYELADSLLRGTITDDEARRLKQLARQSAEARRHYARFMYDSVKLCQWGSDIAAAADEPFGDDRERPDPESRTPGVGIGAHCVPSSPWALDPLGLLSSFGGAVLCYTLAAALLGAGVLAAWTWALPHGSPRAAGGAPAGASPAQVAVITGVVDCRWADASTAIEPGAAVLAGRRFVLASGLLQILYVTRVEVILQGPAIYEADSRDGGFLSLGRLTARVEKRPETDSRERTAPGAARRSSAPDFTIRTPSAILANQAAMPGPGLLGSSEFGVIVDSPEVTRVHVFRGLVTTQLAGGGTKNAMVVPLAANRSLLLARPGGCGMTNLGQKSTMSDVLFARRAVVLPDGQREQVAWLRAIGTGPQRDLVAVGSGDGIELPPTTALPGAAASPAAPHASSASSPDGPQAGIVYTCRLTFDLGDLSPATVMLRCDYVARNSIAAIRLNGKRVRRSQAVAAKADAWLKEPDELLWLKESGEFLIHGGLCPGFFVAGTNVLEIDVNNAHPSDTPHMLLLRPEVSGIRIFPTNAPVPEVRGARDATTEQRGAKH